LQNQISEEDNAAFIGRSVEVLVEGPSKWASGGRQSPDAAVDQATLPGWHDGASQADGSAVVPLSSDSQSLSDSSDIRDVGLGGTQLVGRTKCDRIVVFDGNPRLAGTLADVSIHDCTQTTLIGAIVTREVQHGSHELLPILG
jgi:tRNA-2-methylthio-N6-dimethylallyladenosine synthase